MIDGDINIFISRIPEKGISITCKKSGRIDHGGSFLFKWVNMYMITCIKICGCLCMSKDEKK